ncbi:MAG: hypothetical protein JWO74_1867 [Solirubrobacterales bacterium]|jgi:hypothetical protein|nr:hypothetical protein [Solirubrobacterales bacterium]
MPRRPRDRPARDRAHLAEPAMRAHRLSDGRLCVARRLEGEGVVGDALEVVGPDDPEFLEWNKDVDVEQLLPADGQGMTVRWDAGSRSYGRQGDA